MPSEEDEEPPLPKSPKKEPRPPGRVLADLSNGQKDKRPDVKPGKALQPEAEEENVPMAGSSSKEKAPKEDEDKKKPTKKEVLDDDPQPSTSKGLKSVADNIKGEGEDSEEEEEEEAYEVEKIVDYNRVSDKLMSAKLLQCPWILKGDH